MLPLRDNVPTRTFPIVTVGLIAANAAVWFWELHGSPWEQEVVRYGFYPCSVHGPCVGLALQHHLPWFEGVFTGMFMHAGWEHILGNMLFLWIFGNNVEDALGHVRFLLWYLAAGIAAAGLQTLVTLHYAGAAAASVPNIGASGAIAGVLGAYFILLPRARVLTWIVIIIREIPAFWFLGIWFLYQAYLGDLSLTHPGQSGGVALFAHVGGFLFGVLTVKLVQVRQPLRPSYT
jgi:membrane associated rhomboid family serine protease